MRTSFYFLIMISFFSSFFSRAKAQGNLPVFSDLKPDVQYRLQYDWAWIERYMVDNQLLISEKDTVRIIYFGDSITEGWPDAAPQFFQSNPNFVNRGIGGQTTGQLLLRFRQDVLALKPQTLVLMIGINDIAENNGPYDEDITAGNIFSILELSKLHGIKVILCSVIPANNFVWRTSIERVGEKVLSLNAQLEAYAQKNNIPYCDYYAQLVDNQQGVKTEYTTDGVHLTPSGYQVMIKILTPFLKK